MIGASPVMQAVFRMIDRVAASRASVLVTGETGTGKELVAKAIHEQSPRAKNAFVKVHCAALAETLLESELFGHERGSFTGSISRREGRFKQADGGTLFLDEIGDISAAVQVKLLRVLQERAFERVGGNETIHVDVRIVAATNRDLPAAIAAGRFREDLFYRLNVVSVDMPPLRARPDDLPLLADHFLRFFAADNGKDVDGFDEAAFARLLGYRWPGNVRELENVIERSVVLCEEPLVSIADLPAHLRQVSGTAIRVPGSTLADVERDTILATLAACDGHTGRTAKVLGVSIRKIQYRMREYESAGEAIAETPSGVRLKASAPSGAGEYEPEPTVHDHAVSSASA